MTRRRRARWRRWRNAIARSNASGWRDSAQWWRDALTPLHYAPGMWRRERQRQYSDGTLWEVPR